VVVPGAVEEVEVEAEVGGVARLVAEAGAAVGGSDDGGDREEAAEHAGARRQGALVAPQLVAGAGLQVRKGEPEVPHPGLGLDGVDAAANVAVGRRIASAVSVIDVAVNGADRRETVEQWC